MQQANENQEEKYRITDHLDTIFSGKPQGEPGGWINTHVDGPDAVEGVLTIKWSKGDILDEILNEIFGYVPEDINTTQALLSPGSAFHPTNKDVQY